MLKQWLLILSLVFKAEEDPDIADEKY